MLYRVKNLADKDLFIDWTLTMLSDEHLAEYKEYEREVFQEISHSQEQMAATSRNRVRIADILKEWVQMVQLGDFKTEINPSTRRMERVPRMNPATKAKEYIPMYKLAAGAEDIVNERQVDNFRKFERRDIEQALKTGESEHKIQHEGFVEIDEVTMDEETQLAAEQGINLEERNYNEMSFRQLRDEAASLGITVPFGTSKVNLTKLLQQKNA